MEEMHRARYRKRTRSFHALLMCAILPYYVFINLDVLKTSIWDFIEASLQRCDWLNHWLLVTDSASNSLSSSLFSSRGETKSSNPLFLVSSPGNQSPSFCAFQKSPSNVNPIVVQRGLLWITRHSFYLYGSEVLSGTEDKKIQQSMFPLLSCSGNSKVIINHIIIGTNCRDVISSNVI